MHLRHSAIYRHRWHLVVTFIVIILPFAFLLVFSRLANLATGKLFEDIGISALRLVAAYTIAALLGWAGAVAFSSGRRATIALPLFDVLQCFPAFAVLPLATIILGATNATVILFLAFTTLWPILFSITSSLRLARKEWTEVATIARLRGFRYLRYFLIPVTIPGLITGSIISIGEAWEALVATEMVIHTPKGLGTFFQTHANNPTITAFGILGFLLLIFSVNKLIWLPLLDWSHRKMEW